MFNTKLIVGIVVLVLLGGGVVFYFFSVSGSSATNSDTNSADVIAESETRQAEAPLPIEATSSAPEPEPKKETITTPPPKPKPAPTPKPQPSPEPRSRLIAGKITAYVTDQYGNPCGGTSGMTCYISAGAIYDALGERAGGASIQNGQLESSKTFPAGTYTLVVGETLYKRTPVVKEFALPAEGVNLGTLIVPRWGSVTLTVTNEVGTPLVNTQSLLHWRLTKCEITDAFVKEEDENRYPKNAPSTCAWLSNHSVGGLVLGEQVGVYPAGNYTLELSASGYEPVEKSFTVNNKDVNLGTVVLKKQ